MYRGFRVNVFCLVGAILGVIAIFSRWIGNWLIELNLIDVINLNDSLEGASHYFVPGLLFAIGTLVAFLSPLGGFLQLAGAPWFIYVWADRHEGEILSSIGPYLGIASAIIVVAAMLRPIGPGLMVGPYAVGDRLLNFGRKPVGKVAAMERQKPQPHWVGMYCKYCGRPLAEEALRCPGCGRSVEGEMPERRP